MQSKLATDDDLMRGVCAGDADAMALLAERWMPRLTRFGCRYLGDPGLAEDLVQEVLWRVHRARDKYRPEGKFAPWIYRIATRVAENLRTRGRRPQTSLEELDELPLAAPVDLSPLQLQERTALVDWALGQLSEAQRLVVVLRHYEGLKFDEVARMLSQPVSTIKSRYRASLDRLYVLFKTAGHDPLEE